MNDLISRQAAIDEIDEWIKAFRENGHKESAADACLIQDGIIQLPSAQPERKKGKWIKHIDDLFPAESTLECNVCHHEQPITIDDNYCPNCGADMRGDQDESD